MSQVYTNRGAASASVSELPGAIPREFSRWAPDRSGTAIRPTSMTKYLRTLTWALEQALCAITIIPVNSILFNDSELHLLQNTPIIRTDV
jgi:hypothetical protein